jgi:hypothetical protein
VAAHTRIQDATSNSVCHALETRNGNGCVHARARTHTRHIMQQQHPPNTTKKHSKRACTHIHTHGYADMNTVILFFLYVRASGLVISVRVLITNASHASHTHTPTHPHPHTHSAHVDNTEHNCCWEHKWCHVRCASEKSPKTHRGRKGGDKCRTGKWHDSVPEVYIGLFCLYIGLFCLTYRSLLPYT